MSEYLFQQNATPPSESNGRPQIAYAKWKYVAWRKSDEQEMRAMLAAGQCRSPARFWKNSVRHAGIYSYQSFM